MAIARFMMIYAVWVLPMGGTRDSYDNILAETINGVYKTGLVRKKSVLNNSVFHLRRPVEMVLLRGRRLLAAARFGQKEA